VGLPGQMFGQTKLNNYAYKPDFQIQRASNLTEMCKTPDSVIDDCLGDPLN